MKSKFLLGILLIALIYACEKDEKSLSTNTITKANYFPLTTGSYWVYNTYELDSLKNETLISDNDTIEIIGDTLIGGNLFAIYYGKMYGFSNASKQEQYFRDSSGYIVNPAGNILLSHTNFSDTLYNNFIPNDSLKYYQFYTMMKEYSQPIDLLSGLFDSVLNCEFHVTCLESAKPFSAGFENLYAPNVGRILKQNAYLQLYENIGKYYEERLIDYNIKP